MKVFTDEAGPAFTHDALTATFEAQTDETPHGVKFESAVIADEVEDHCTYLEDKMKARWQVEVQPFYIDGKIGMKFDMSCEPDKHFEYVINITPGAMEILLSTHILTIAKKTGEIEQNGRKVPTYNGLVVLQLKQSILDSLEQFIPLAMQAQADKINEKIARNGN